MNRQTDRLVEVFDAFAVPALRFTAMRLGGKLTNDPGDQVAQGSFVY